MFMDLIDYITNQVLDSLIKISDWVGGENWLMEGDFNMINSLEEKKGGIRNLSKTSYKFIECMDNIFTWNNKRTRGRNIASRLDRFLVSESTMTMGGELEALVLPTAGSDHWPINLTWEGKQ